MRACEFVVENGGIKDIHPNTKSAVKNATTYPSMNSSTGSSYLNYRMGIALAGAPTFPTKMEAEIWIGGDPMLSAYTDEEYEMIMAASDAVGAGHGKNWSGKRSEEIPGTNKISPIAAVKKNKYGV
jgi:hypothetical protein